MEIQEDSKLNIGCGKDIKNDYINIDCRNIEGVDIVTDVYELDLGIKFTSEIYASDFLEHFSEHDAYYLFTKFVVSLKPGGILDIRVPDLKAVAKRILDYPRNMPMIYRVYGGQDYPSNFHYWGWTPETFKDMISDFNLEIIEEEYKSYNMRFRMRRNGETW